MSFQVPSRVLDNQEIAENTYETFLEAPQIAQRVKPGQFINILPSHSWGNVMRRPMSVAGTDGKAISIIYKAVGPGTVQMSKWKKGEEADIIGPLGNCWSDFEQYPVIIGGGVGIAPILFLHNHLLSLGKAHHMVMGARTKTEHFIDHDPEKGVLLCTDNGTLGIQGTVMDAIEQIRQDVGLENVKLFVCGPPAMMEATRIFSEKEDLPCDIALETVMACGFGICQGCTMKYNETDLEGDSYRKKFGLVCLDGPIFNAKEIKTCYL